jgi:hypothetical protein
MVTPEQSSTWAVSRLVSQLADKELTAVCTTDEYEEVEFPPMIHGRGCVCATL